MNIKSLGVIVVVGLSLALVSLLVVVNSNTEVRSKAADNQIIPTSYVMPPKTQLQVPYIRLVKGVSKDPQTIVVDVYARTGSQSVLETVVNLSYDPSVLQLAEQDISNLEVFPVLNIRTINNGTAIFSLFTSEDAGYSPVMLEKEAPIARLTFLKLNSTSKFSDIELKFSGDSANSSGMYGPRAVNGEISRNMVSSVEGVTVE